MNNLKETRVTYDLNRGWAFIPFGDADSYEMPSEAGAQTVCLPHANTILKRHCADDFQKDIDSYRFVSWYVKHFSGEELLGRHSKLEFEGVAGVADVYLNGEHLGCHKGSYTGFEFDLSDKIKAENTLAVRVDSRRQPGVPPEGNVVDYCVFGGMVRNVKLISTENVYVDDLFVTTPDIKLGIGTANAAIKLKNRTEKACNALVRVEISDSGKTVAAKEVPVQIAPKSESGADIAVLADGVELWSTDHPKLYEMRVCVSVDGKVTDCIRETFGYRWYEIINESESAEDQNYGLYLNGKKLIIRGVNRHEQWPWIGRAVCDKLQAADADMIKSSGINTVRCSHYPQSKAFLKRCDEIGLIVFEEAPGWQHIGDEAWQEVYLKNVEEMVLRDRNHPCIFTWGVRVNESPDNHELYEKSNALAKSLDPSRHTHGVRMAETYAESEFQEDIFCANYSYPEKPRFTPYVITEHSYDWTSGDGMPGAPDEKTAAFIRSFAEPMNYYYANKYCSGGIGWSMFDYNNEVNYTKTGHLFYSGIYDIFRFEKPVAYLYRSQKDPSVERVIYISNRFANQKTGDRISVTVMSNCDEVELVINGKPTERKKPNAYTALPHPVFVFDDVEYEEGTLEAVGYIDGREAAKTSRATPKAPKKLAACPEYSLLSADGADLTMVKVELLDEAGTLLPLAGDELRIEVEGGRFIGDEKPVLEGGRTGFMVQAGCEANVEITCRVFDMSNPDVEPAECKIFVTESACGRCL